MMPFASGAPDPGDAPPVGAEARGRGRPPVHGEPWRRATVVLFDRLIAYLDHLAADMRLRSGAAVNRAEIIRGLIAGLQRSTLDVTHVRSEAELAALVAERLSRDDASADASGATRDGRWHDAPL